MSKAGQIDRAFGEESRRQLLEQYFAGAGAITASNAWKHVYRLLLWIDRTTGLAHCYESDKAQPGRPWYGRSLAFHDWISGALGSDPGELSDSIDWLFTKGTELLAAKLAERQVQLAERASEQMAPYAGRGFPEPGEDPALAALLNEELGEWLAKPPPPEVLRRLARRIRSHLSQENKRKNLVGEGFEDVLAFLIARLPGAGKLEVRARPLLHSLPGFRPPRKNEKPRKVDLAIIGPRQRRILITAKWSVRADREEQFGVDFEAYSRLEDAGKDFGFVLVTNEFDAARLVAACERRMHNAALFSEVVHVNPSGPLAVYGDSGRGAATKLSGYAQGGRLMSLEAWLSSLVS